MATDCAGAMAGAGAVTNGAGAATGVGAVNDGAGAATGAGAVNDGAGAATGMGVGNDFSSLALGVTSTTLDTLFNSLLSLAIMPFCDEHMVALTFMIALFNPTMTANLLCHLQLCFRHLLVFNLLGPWALFGRRFVLWLG